MNCHQQGRQVVAFLITAFAVSSLVGAEPAESRPNILWVVSEDNSYNYVGAYGDPSGLARTPHIDSLARKGITFDRAYTQPVCAPSRCTIITGRYASAMGTQHMRSNQPLPDGVRFFPEYLREAGYFCTNSSKTDYNTSTSWNQAWDENGRTAHWRHRKPGQPFFAVFNFEQSHESRLFFRQPLATDPAQVRVPAYLPDTAVVRADLAQYYDIVSQADRAIGNVLAQLEEDGLSDDTIVFYYSDNGGAVAGSKRFLNDAGTHVALIAHFPEKYAEMAPARPGTHSTDLVNFVDLAPTVLSLAGIPMPAHFHGRAFAGPARSPAPQYTFMFADRMDARYNTVRAVTDGRFRYVRNFHPDRPWGQHSDFIWMLPSMQEWDLHNQARLLNDRQRAFFEPQPAEALYDCVADPDNVNNLAGHPSQKARVREMRAALRDHMLRIRDTGLLPEPMMIRLAAGASPAVVAGDDRQYPLARILDLVDALQLGDPAQASALRGKALDDSLPVVRYWAVSASPASLSQPDLEARLHDEDVVVRIAAAENCLRRGENPAALRVFEEAIIRPPQPTVCLQALDAFARLDVGIPKSIAPTLGRLAGSAEIRPVGAGFTYDFFLSRLSRHLLEFYGYHDLLRGLREAQREEMGAK